jgi:hypothetical protein
MKYNCKIKKQGYMKSLATNYTKRQTQKTVNLTICKKMRFKKQKMKVKKRS